VVVGVVGVDVAVVEVDVELVVGSLAVLLVVVEATGSVDDVGAVETVPGACTLTVLLADSLPDVTLMVAVPGCNATTTPDPETLATIVSLETQRVVRELTAVTGWPFLPRIVAESVKLLPVSMLASAGDTVTPPTGTNREVSVVGSVTSDPSSELSVPEHAAAARRSTGNNMVVRRITVWPSENDAIRWPDQHGARERRSFVALRPRVSTGLPLSWPIGGPDELGLERRVAPVRVYYDLLWLG